MNNNPGPMTPAEFCMLAEGESNCGQLHTLVERIEQTPDGWKQCALAFLETQALSRSIREVVQNRLPERAIHDLKSRLSEDRNQSVSKLPVLWLTAALLLIACGFGLGTLLSHRNDMTSSKGNVSNLEETEFATHQILTDQTLRHLTLCVNAIDLPDSEVLAVANLQVNDRVQLIPIIRSQFLERQISLFPKPELPEGLGRELQQSGWVASLSRQLLSINSPSGKRQVMPLDSVAYQFVGQKTF